MKKLIIAAVFAAISTLSFAQHKKQVYLELFGPSNIVGVSFDSRFTPNTNFGYRVGISYFQLISRNNYSFNSLLQPRIEFPHNLLIEPSIYYKYSETARLIGMPLELNYLLGKKKHFFEVAGGLNLNLYVETTKKEEKFIDISSLIGYNRQIKTKPDNVYSTDLYFAYQTYLNLGYRYQPITGFSFRAGLSFSTTFEENSHMEKPFLFPYISFGYAF